MGAEPAAAPGLSSHDLGPQLEPALVDACGGRLSDIHWFKVDWQQSGAATAYATFTNESGTHDVVIKIPVGPREYRFSVGLSGRDRHFASILAHATEIGGYDLAWLVMERLPGDPLAARLHKKVFLQLADAAASFYNHARDAVPDITPRQDEDWESEISAARESVRENHIPDEQDWSNALKETSKILDRILQRWRARPTSMWCHGDLHPGNLMMRPEESAHGKKSPVLLDMAEVHAGHWVEDAVYVERRFWARPDLMKGIKPVAMIAKAIRQIGMEIEGDHNDLANIRRVLMAATCPAFLRSEGHPAHLAGALRVLTNTLPLVR